MSADDTTLLIYAPVPLYRQGGVLMVEAQAANGLRLWAENFSRVLVAMPEAPGPAPLGWRAYDPGTEAGGRVEIQPLPSAWRPDRFLRALGPGRATLRALIARADYMSFAIGGLFGDWGAVAAFEAHRMRRPFAVWTDRVESAVTRHEARSGPWRKRLRARLYHRPMAALERAVIRRAALGLFHGRETYDSYAPYSANPQLVHDIHVARADHIDAGALAAKQAAAAEGPLRIIYAGRASAMKGGRDWVGALEALARAGVAFEARWLGEGDELAAMRARVGAAGLDGQVTFPGFVADRLRLLDALRGADILMFCHKTPESPRILIEALISGTPIVGYDAAYPRDLIAGAGGGLLVPPGDVPGLARAVAGLDADRARLAALIARAGADGARFDDESVFRHRSDLIKEHLGHGV